MLPFHNQRRPHQKQTKHGVINIPGKISKNHLNIEVRRQRRKGNIISKIGGIQAIEEKEVEGKAIYLYFGPLSINGYCW